MENLIEKLKEIKGVSFVSITYTNQNNEKQQTVFNVGVDYAKAKIKDIEYLKTLDVETLNSNIDSEILEEARIALLNSFENPSEKKSKGIIDAYTHLTKGIKIHNDSKKLFVFGMKVSKTVLEKGNEKEDTRGILTKAKDEIRKHLKSTQYRNFELKRADKFVLKGDTITFEAE